MSMSYRYGLLVDFPDGLVNRSEVVKPKIGEKNEIRYFGNAVPRCNVD